MKIESLTYFRPLSGRQKLDPHLKIVALDSEYDSKTKQLKLIGISQLKHRNNQFQFDNFQFDNCSDLLSCIIRENFTLIYCFNISADITFILSELHRQQIEYNIIESSKILGITFKINKIRYMIKDFFVYALTSLEDFAKFMLCEQKKYPNNIQSKEEWEKFFNTCNLEELKKHNTQDTKILCECIFRFRNLVFDKFNVDFMQSKIYSLASLSMKIYRIKFLKYKLKNPFIITEYDIRTKKYSSKVNRELYDFVRKSYKGGFTDCISNKLYSYQQNEILECFDINSAHPFNATNIKYFPHGNAYETKYFKEFELKTRLIPSVCEIEIDFSSNKYYYIPVNVQDEKGNLHFKRCFNKINQVITSIELRYLMQHNISFKFIKGYYFRTYDKSFSLYNFFTSIYKDRRELDELHPLKLILKIIMNALYGKFGQKIDCERIINHTFLTFEESEEFCQFNGLNDIKKIADNLFVVLEKTNIEMKKAFMIVLWSSLITAGTRIQLIDMIQKTNAIMWDTDSVYFLKNNHPIDFIESDKLGGWKLEKECREFRCLAPKLYAYEYYDKKKEKWIKVVKAKGVPKEKRIALYDAIISGKSELEIDNIIKILSYKECCRGIKSTYNSDIFVKTLETKKKLVPKLKYTKEELNLFQSSSECLNIKDI